MRNSLKWVQRLVRLTSLKMPKALSRQMLARGHQQALKHWLSRASFLTYSVSLPYTVHTFTGLAASIIAIAFVSWLIFRTPRQKSVELAIVMNDANGQIGLRADGSIVGLEVVPELGESARNTLNSRAFHKLPILADLIGDQGVPRGRPRNGLPFALNSPVGTVVVTDQPTFEWDAHVVTRL